MCDWAKCCIALEIQCVSMLTITTHTMTMHIYVNNKQMLSGLIPIKTSYPQFIIYLIEHVYQTENA